MENKEHIPVCYEGQDDLIDILATSICSICYNTKSFIDFYILDCGINNFNKKQLEKLKYKFNNFSIKYIPIDLTVFNGLKGWGKDNFLDCYSRLLIPKLIPELDKVIYLDTDTIALDDIKLLWEQNLDEYEIGACPDTGYNKYLRKNCIENLGFNNQQIFINAGMLLIDCKRWRQNNVSDKLLNLAKTYKDHLIIINEELLGIYYKNNNFKILDSRFNCADRLNEIKEFFPTITDEYLKNEWNDVVIQHLTPFKPWMFCKNTYNNRNLKNFENFWFFAQITPFYQGMVNKYFYNINCNISNHIIVNIKFGKYWVKLLNVIPFIKVEIKNDNKVYKLFGILPVLKIRSIKC